MKHLKINNLQPVQENFWGNGAIYHGFAGMPDDACRIYTEQQCDMEADRAADMRLKLARTFYRWYAWDPQTDTWDWDNAEMTAFYRWLQRMKDRNITVALNTGWWCPGDINGTCHAGKSPFYVEGDWTASIKKYGDWVSESLHQLIELRGFTNIKILVLFTEPADYAGKSTEDGMSPYDYWYTASKAAHDALVRDHRRHLVWLMGPNEGRPAWHGSLIDFDMLRWAASRADDFIDLYSAHTYRPVGLVPYSYLEQGRGAINITIAGGRIHRTVCLKANSEYTATITLDYNRHTAGNCSGRILFGVFEDLGIDDIYANGLPAPALTQNSVLSIDPNELHSAQKTISFSFQTESNGKGCFGVFYDVKGKADITVSRLELTDTNGNLIIENDWFRQGMTGWTTFMCGTMDSYHDWYTWTKSALKYVPKNKGFIFDEYNVVYDRDNSRPTHGAEISTAAVAMMNAGVQSSMLWSLFDQQWPNNHVTSADSFVDGDHRCGVMPVLTRSAVPYRSYYAFTLISRYTGGEGTCVYEGFGEHRLNTVMTVSKNGEITVIVVNEKENADEFTLHFKVALNGVELYRHCFDPKSCVPDETAAVIGPDKKIAPVYQTFCDTIPAYGVAVYTTQTD